MVEQHAFDEVAQALRGLVPGELGPLHTRAHRYGIKVWFGPAKPPREHYEAQVVGAQHVPEAKALAIEVGFHTEHPDPTLDAACLAALVGHERRWRKALGPEAVAAPFIADRHGWQRLSETWPDPDLSDPEIASRSRRASPTTSPCWSPCGRSHRPGDGCDRVTPTTA